MLKFVHTKPPRARSTSPAGSTVSLDRSSSPRHRDRPPSGAYPPFPQQPQPQQPPLHPPHQHHPHLPPHHHQGEVVGYSLPRGRGGDFRGGRSYSPGSSSRTSTASPAISIDVASGAPPFFEGEFYDHGGLYSSGTLPTTLRESAAAAAGGGGGGGSRSGGRVSFPEEIDFRSGSSSSFGRFPVTDKDRESEAELEKKEQERRRDQERETAATEERNRQHQERDRVERERDRERERTRTSSPRDRHVRIAPYPPEEFYIGSRPVAFPVSDKDRDSPSLTATSPPQSILSKHPKHHHDPHYHRPSDVVHVVVSKPPRDVRSSSDVVHFSAASTGSGSGSGSGSRPPSHHHQHQHQHQQRDSSSHKQWSSSGAERQQEAADNLAPLWTPIDPAASGIDASSWAQQPSQQQHPHHHLTTSGGSRSRGQKGKDVVISGHHGGGGGDKIKEIGGGVGVGGSSGGGDRGRGSSSKQGKDSDVTVVATAGGHSGGGGKDRFWKPKLFFSGSWLHGPSRHRIFATKSAQPHPQSSSPQPQPSAVMTTCVPQVSNDLSNEALNKPQSARSVGQSSQGSRGIMSSLRDMLNRSQDGADELLLDLTYVTERIISMSFPSEGHDTTYAFNLKDVVRMLKTKHGDNYLVLNLSEKRQDLVKANPQVKEYGWPDHLAPPLERLCSVCKAVDAWLNADHRNVAVLHCKGGRARIAIIIAAYMHYSNICASADQALDRFAMKRFYDDKLGGLPLPSQRRYVHYFAGLLSGAIKINSNALYLHHILIHGVPNFDTRGGCRPFIKVYQGMQPIFTSGVYNVTDNMQKVCISISPGIPLRGDILIKCYHKKARSGQREVIWQCQFHTCAIQDNNVVFSKQELDDGIHDPRFPDNGKVEFVFGPSSDVPVSVSGFKSDVTVPVDDNEDSLTRSDSYENFHKALAAQGLKENANNSTHHATLNGVSSQQQQTTSRVHVSQTQQHQQHQQQQQQQQQQQPVEHIQGPWDGSLYATVNKQREVSTASHAGLAHNGSSHLPNGSLTSSVDSGYAGVRDTSYGSQHHQLQQQQHQAEVFSSIHASSQVSSQLQQQQQQLQNQQQRSAYNNSSSSTLTRNNTGAVVDDHLNYNSLPRQQQASQPPLDERSQLDELLSDLLSDQVISSPTSQLSPRSPQQQGQGPASPQGNAMSGVKAVTTTTHTYSTYSSTDGMAGSGGGRVNPADKVLIQRAEVTYKVPGQGEERHHYTIAGEPPELEKPRVPKGAFTYTPTSPQGTDQSRSFQTLERDMNRTTEQMVTHSLHSQQQQSPPPRTHTLPYRADYENRYNNSSSDSQLYNTMDGDQASWLQQQQQKLMMKRDGRDTTGRTEQEKQLVNELKFAQNRYYNKRATSDAEEQATVDSYQSPVHHNGPSSLISPSSAPQSYAPPPRGFGGDTGHFNTFSTSSQSSSQYVENYGGGGGADPRGNKPPPSPTMQRSMLTTSIPIQPPARTSSKDYMRSRSNSSSNTWQQQQQQASPPQSSRPMVRQYSDTLYDRETGPNLQARHHAPSSYSTPPHSPRARSPTGPAMGPTATTTYTTYRTIHKDVRDEPMARQPVQPVQQVVKAPPPVQAPPPAQPLPNQENHHNYITEVFVHRVGADKQAQDNSSLDNLSRSLQAAQDSINQDRVSQQQQQSQSFQQSWQEHYQTSQTQKQEQQQQTLGPAPKPVSVIEEDRISLKPIGPGMQTLEPENTHSSTSTLNRATTPSFPTSPVTPPFPVSPRSRTVQGHTVRSPYTNIPSRSFDNRSLTSDIPSVRVQHHDSNLTLTESLGPVFQSTESLGGGSLSPSVFRSSDPLYAAIPDAATRARMASAASRSGGGGGMVSPMGTMSQQTVQQHQQNFHQQQQQYHQHSQSQQQLNTDNSLHIDTSNRMLAPGQARSPSSPPSPGNLNTLRQQLSAAHSMSGSVVNPHSLTGQSSPSVYFGLSRRGSLSSLADSDMVNTTPKFVKDTSRFWYKPNITREDAIVLLRDKAPGTFVIRDSNSFPGAFGLALKVAHIPANVAAKPTNDPQAELVRHFLIEPTPKGVRLRGCSNEPVFGSLASLVYQHSITPLALPCKLALPDAGDTVDGPSSPEVMSPTELNSAADLLAKGAACNVVFINTVDTESLTGPQAIAKAIKMTIDTQPALKTTVVHFKVSSQGITLTDNNRKLFFRRHYPVSAVTYCGMDPQDRRWKRDPENPNSQADAKIFGFVARKQGGVSDNSCHLFAELDPEQPASAIVNFVTKVMIGQSKVKS